MFATIRTTIIVTINLFCCKTISFEYWWMQVTMICESLIADSSIISSSGPVSHPPLTIQHLVAGQFYRNLVNNKQFIGLFTTLLWCCFIWYVSRWACSRWHRWQPGAKYNLNWWHLRCLLCGWANLEMGNFGSG